MVFVLSLRLHAETYETLHKKTKKVFKVTPRRPDTMHTELRKKHLLEEFVTYRV